MHLPIYLTILQDSQSLQPCSKRNTLKLRSKPCVNKAGAACHFEILSSEVVDISLNWKFGNIETKFLQWLDCQLRKNYSNNIYRTRKNPQENMWRSIALVLLMLLHASLLWSLYMARIRPFWQFHLRLSSFRALLPQFSLELCNLEQIDARSHCQVIWNIKYNLMSRRKTL